jgi:hypothetical protein
MDAKLHERDRAAKLRVMYSHPRSQDEKRPATPGHLVEKQADERGELANRHQQERDQLRHRHAIEERIGKNPGFCVLQSSLMLPQND